MIKYISFIFITIGMYQAAFSQLTNRYHITASAGFGSVQDFGLSAKFSLSASMHLTKGLHLSIGMAKTNASEKLDKYFSKDEQSQIIKPYIERDRISDHDILATIINIQSYGIGLEKYLQMGDKTFISGGLQFTYNSISSQRLSDALYAQVEEISEGDLYPIYASYKKTAGNVTLKVNHFLSDYVSIHIGGSYNTAPARFIGISGVSLWF